MTQKFCSFQCYWDSLKGKQYSWLNKGGAHNTGKKQSLEAKIKMSATKQKIPLSEWKTFKESINTQIRKSFEYKQWRESVFRRDGYTCQECGQKGGELHAHHIKPFAFFPLLRFEISNGLTLCKECHIKIGVYPLRTVNYA